MKIAIYSPYLDTLGGGERYMLTIAEHFSSNHTTDILVDSHLIKSDLIELKRKLSERFDLDLDKVNLVPAPIGINTSFLKRYFFLKQYDLLIALTDGSIFYCSAKRGILHIQTPLRNNSLKSSVWGKTKLSSWDEIIYNSFFTQSHAKEYWPIPSQVIYPPVDVEKIKPLRKKKYILTVGRFFGYLKEKKHEVMIQAFKDLISSEKLTGWTLIIVGSAGEGDKEYVNDLQDMSRRFPINILTNLAYENLVKLYGEATVYWHAMGYQESDPTKMEHFGITTVEAMAGGAVPVVVNKGGQTEIVENGVNGFLWDDLEELKGLTIRLVNDRSLMERVSQKAQEKSKEYSKEEFCKKIDQLLNGEMTLNG